jgi:hypothetical protein
MYDSYPWDAKWLMDTHHLAMQPLPEDWQSKTDEAELQTILGFISTETKRLTP